MNLELQLFWQIPKNEIFQFCTEKKQKWTNHELRKRIVTRVNILYDNNEFFLFSIIANLQLTPIQYIRILS